MVQKTVPSVATHQALQTKRLAALCAQLCARVERRPAAIQSQPGNVLNELTMPLDYALRRTHEDRGRPHIFVPSRLAQAAALHPTAVYPALEFVAVDVLAD